MEDTIAIITKNKIILNNDSEITIKKIKRGWKLTDNDNVVLNMSYNAERKIYNIKMLTATYPDNLVNLLAWEYAIRKCKELIETENSVFLFTSIIY